MKQAVIYQTLSFLLISWGNGVAYSFEDLRNASSVWVQGDDADTFSQALQDLEDANRTATTHVLLGKLWDQYSDAAQPVLQLLAA